LKKKYKNKFGATDMNGHSKKRVGLGKDQEGKKRSGRFSSMNQVRSRVSRSSHVTEES
jgi:hypothetical protein